MLTILWMKKYINLKYLLNLYYPTLFNIIINISQDKRDLGIDSASLKIKAEYSDNSSRKRQLPMINTGPIPGKPVLGDILKPIK